MGSNPLERFTSLVLKAIEKEEAQIFGIALVRRTEVITTPLSRRKNPPLTYKVSTSLGQWVVKFNPLGPSDPWYDVKKEHSILQALYPYLPVPKPIYASTDSDERMVGTAFIVMEFVEGDSYGCASDIPAGTRSSICTAAVKAMAQVHHYFWVAAGQKKHDGLSRDFWYKQVSTWCNNYSSGSDGESTRRLFRTMQTEEKPNGRNTVVIHGDANISNFVFERSRSGQYKVKAILDWKYDTNGDPMVDVGYFLMMFLQPSAYGYPALARLDLLMGPPGSGTPSESQLLDTYYAEARRLIDAPSEVKNSKPVFLYPGVLQNFIRAYEQSVFADDRTRMLNYAKAVCCLRLITVVKAAWSDNWRGHESGKHAGVRNHPQEVIEMLTAAGWSFHGKS